MLKYILLSLVILIYVIISSIIIIKSDKRKKAVEHIQKKKIFLIFYEKKLLELLNIPKNKVGIFIYAIRLFIIITIIVMAIKMGFIALFFILAILSIIYSNMQNSKLVDATGIKYLPLINSFLDNYIPSIASGLSNDQAMLKFVHQENDENLSDWWLNKDNIINQVVVENKWLRIIEIYNMMRFNESKGLSNSLPVIEEMQKDLNTKQKYYEDYLAKMGEIKPIILSYYIGVPLLIMMSYSQTKDFWSTIWGFGASIVLAILFFTFQLLIYKLRKDTINSLF